MSDIEFQNIVVNYDAKIEDLGIGLCYDLSNLYPYRNSRRKFEFGSKNVLICPVDSSLMRHIFTPSMAYMSMEDLGCSPATILEGVAFALAHDPKEFRRCVISLLGSSKRIHGFINGSYELPMHYEIVYYLCVKGNEREGYIWYIDRYDSRSSGFKTEDIKSMALAARRV